MVHSFGSCYIEGTKDGGPCACCRASEPQERTYMKVGIVGLGVMGLPMMSNVIRAGHSVIGYDLNPRSMEKFGAAGGQPVDSVAGACRDVEVLITMLPDSPQVKEVVEGPGGLLDSGQAGLVHIDMSTIRPDVSRQLAQLCAKKGISSLDAPVSGGEIGAVEASLSIMVGGPKETFDFAEPLLHAMGRTVIHLGPSGAGQTVKAANQLIVGGTYGLVAEAIVFIEAHGVDASAALKVLGGGLAGSRILELKGESMLARKFEPGFRIDLHHKDMGIVTSAAREAGVVIPIGSLVAQLIASARLNGLGHLDHSALLKVIEQLSGTSNR